MPKLEFLENLKNKIKNRVSGDVKKSGINAEHEELNKQLIRHRVVLIQRGLVGTFVIVLLIALVCLFNIFRIYTGYRVLTDIERSDSDTAVYIPYNGTRVIKYSQDGAEAFDGKNNALWNITFEMQNPQIATCGEWAALGDFKGNLIYVVNSNGIVSQLETKYPVSAFCIAGQGVVAAVLEGDEQMKINLYSPSGDLLAEMKCTMANSGYPIDVAISDDGMKLGVSYVRIDAGKLKSSVAFYNFDEVGQNEIDNYVSGYDYVDTVVPKVHFLNGDTAFALGDNRLVIYKGSQKPTSQYESFINEEVKSLYYGSDMIALVFRDSEDGSKYRIDVYDDNGKQRLSEKIDFEYTDIVLSRDNIIVYNDKRCCMYKAGGRKKYEGSFEEAVLLLVPGDTADRWTLVSKNNIKTVRLQ